MISASDFRNGMTFEDENGGIFVVQEFQHVKPGKGAAFVRAKVRNLVTGSTVEKTFRPNEKMQKAHIDRRDMEYLYNDGELFHFMDSESYEQIALNQEDVGDTLKFVRENDVVKVLSHSGKVFGIEPNTHVELLITETEPGLKGDTAQGATKPCTVETGAIVYVPLFIENGERIKIDTRTGEYLGRAN